MPPRARRHSHRGIRRRGTPCCASKSQPIEDGGAQTIAPSQLYGEGVTVNGDSLNSRMASNPANYPEKRRSRSLAGVGFRWRCTSQNQTWTKTSGLEYIPDSLSSESNRQSSSVLVCALRTGRL